MVYGKATAFSLTSVDHDNVLLNEEVHSVRNLLNSDAELPKQLKFSFEVDGVQREAVLNREKGAFGEKATVKFMGENGIVNEVSPDNHFAYYSADRNWVITFHGDNKFDGLLFEDNNSKVHHFVGEKGVLKVNGNARDFFPGEMKGRGLTSEANGIDYWDDCHPAQATGLSRMDLGFVVGYVMFEAFGEEGSIAEANSYITLSNTIYERQMDVSLAIQDVFVATTPNLANFLPGTCSQSIQTQLQRFASWGKPSDQVLWHMIEDCFGASGGVLGIAYLGTLCSRNNVGVTYYSDDRYSDDEYPTWATVAHELGHNFDGAHSFEEGQGRTGGIMDYGFLKDRLINGEIQFNSQYREREVCREVTNRNSCLVQGIAPSPTGQFTVPEAEEVEIFAEQERKLTCAKHKNRMPNSSKHLKKLNDLNRIECQKACADRSLCKGFVFDRSGWCELLDDVEVESMVFTSEFDTFVCSEGTLLDRFKGRSVDDQLDEINVAPLKEECCVSESNKGYLGMNMFYREGLSLAECQETCVKNSRCEASTFMEEQGSCMFFGGRDFTHQSDVLFGAETLSCDRTCLTATLNENVSDSSSDSSNPAAIIGSIAVVVGLVGGVIAAALYKKRSKTTEAEGAVYKATL